MTRALRGIGLALCLALPVAAQDLSHDILQFDDLRGWAADDHAAALEVFLNTCPDLQDADWRALCALGQQGPDARTFFELFFRPVMISDGRPALFTGYFEPELRGARRPDERFRYPVYREPPEARLSNPWLTRREIETTDAMRGRGLEIAWVDDPVELGRRFAVATEGLSSGSGIREHPAGQRPGDPRGIRRIERASLPVDRGRDGAAWDISGASGVCGCDQELGTPQS